MVEQELSGQRGDVVDVQIPCSREISVVQLNDQTVAEDASEDRADGCRSLSADSQRGCSTLGEATLAEGSCGIQRHKLAIGREGCAKDTRQPIER